MKYIDLHCDALTKEGVAAVSGESLRAGGCLLQCFAVFLRRGEGLGRAMELLDAFDALRQREGLSLGVPQGEGIGAVPTVENGGSLGLGSLEPLVRRGVRMMGLTWNYPTAFGYPAFPDYDGCRAGRVPFYARETERGLTPLGKEYVRRMAETGMIPDVSHGSDRLLSDVAEACRTRGVPFVASHSGAAEVYPSARNLTDGGIRAVAESGGVVGLCLVPAFLSRDESCEGQREAFLAHARRIVRVGGEDALALGTDFDGAPKSPFAAGPEEVPRLLAALEGAFGPRVAEKIAFRNALRVLGT